MFKKMVSVIIAFSIAFLLLTGCSSSKKERENATRTVVDRSGNTITIPENINSYAVAWAGLTDILLMFDGTEHLVAYPEKSASFKWIFDVYPDYSSKIELSNEGISVEEVINTGANVVFLKSADDENLYNELNKCGIAAVDCHFDTYEELQEVMKLISEVLNTEEAKNKVNEYNTYLENVVNNATHTTEGIAVDNKHSVLVMKDTKAFSAYGSSRYTGKWVEMCGGNYAMVNDDSYANVNLTREQIFEYNPDYIFFAMPGQAEKFNNDSTWQNLYAVKNSHVINIPGGFNTWSNCGAESALIFSWAPSILYPEYVDYNIKDIVSEFYFKFYGYKISDNEFQSILNSSF